jgi:hypothetical protein
MKLAWVLTRTIRTAGLRKNGGSNGFFFRKMSFSESHSAPFGNLAGDSLDHASADVKFVDVTNITGINDHGDFRAPEQVLELFGRIAPFRVRMRNDPERAPGEWYQVRLDGLLPGGRPPSMSC